MGFTLYRTDDEIKKLWNDFSTEIYPLCRSYMQNENAADKALVKVFIEAMKYEHDFETTLEAKRWLLSETEAVCLKMLRSWWENDSVSAGEFFENELETPRNTAPDNTSGTCADRRAAQKITADSPADINVSDEFKEIMKLPAKFKLVFFLDCMENLSAAEIGEITGLPVNTVRNRLHKAKQFLTQTSASGTTASSDLRSVYSSVSLPADKSLMLLDFVVSKAHDEEFYSNIIPEEEQKDSDDYDNTAYFSDDFDDMANSVALLKSNLPKLLPGAVCIIIVIVISIWYFIKNPM